jgi:cysteine-rich repeat protein
MMQRVALFSVLLATSAGCTVVVNGTLDMKRDGGGGGDTGPTGCVADSDCDDGEPCNGEESCGGGECQSGESLSDGTTCDTMAIPAGVCMSGVCVAPPGCGDGNLDEGETCDDGNLTNGDGCDDDCEYSCQENADCNDLFVCNGEETCDLDVRNNLQRCIPAEFVPAQGTGCTLVDDMSEGSCYTDGMIAMEPLCCDSPEMMRVTRCCNATECMDVTPP